jgi:hypothetical protein
MVTDLSALTLTHCRIFMPALSTLFCKNKLMVPNKDHGTAGTKR